MKAAILGLILGLASAAQEPPAQNPGTEREIGLKLLQQRDFSGAAKAFRKAVGANPRDFESRYNLALALANAGRPAEGITEIEAILRQKPGWAPAFFGLGHIRVMQGRIAPAEQSFRTAIRLDPSLIRAHFELGKLLEQSGDREGAIREMETAIRLDPQFAAARYRLSRLLRQTGQKDRGAAELSRMRTLGEQRANGEQAALAYQQALERLDREDFEGAAGDLERAIRLRPDFVEIRPALAEVYRRWGALLENRGETGRAIAEFRKAVQNDPDPETQNHIGVLLAKSGNLPAAIEHFRAALALRPGYPSAAANLEQAVRLLKQSGSR